MNAKYTKTRSRLNIDSSSLFHFSSDRNARRPDNNNSAGGSLRAGNNNHRLPYFGWWSSLVLGWILIFSGISAAQPYNVPQQASLDPTSPFYGVQFFFNYQLPAAIDSVGNSIGVVSQDQVVQDHINTIQELQAEQQQLIIGVSSTANGQSGIDANTFLDTAPQVTQSADNSFLAIQNIQQNSVLSPDTQHTIESAADTQVALTSSQSNIGADVSSPSAAALDPPATAGQRVAATVQTIRTTIANVLTATGKRTAEFVKAAKSRRSGR